MWTVVLGGRWGGRVEDVQVDEFAALVLHGC